MIIYIRAGREIYRKRRKMLNFSSTGTGTAIGNDTFSPEFSSIFNYKTTEVTQTTEIIQPPPATAKPGSGHPNQNPSYSVTISADAQAANQLHMRPSLEDTIDTNDAATGTATLTNTTTPLPDSSSSNSSTKRSRRVLSTTQISIAPTAVTATITTTCHPHNNNNPNNPNTTTTTGITLTDLRSRRRNYYESHNATWSYTKCAILFFSVLLITWIPSSGNRVYSLLRGGDVSKPLFFASAFVLPLQGFWNAIIYVVTSWAACRSLWGECVAGVRGGWWRDGGADGDGDGDGDAGRVGGVGRMGWGWGRRGSVVEITDVVARRRGSGRQGGGGSGAGGGGVVGMWMGRKEMRRESESTSMEDLTAEGRVDDRGSSVV